MITTIIPAAAMRIQIARLLAWCACLQAELEHRLRRVARGLRAPFQQDVLLQLPHAIPRSLVLQVAPRGRWEMPVAPEVGDRTTPVEQVRAVPLERAVLARAATRISHGL